MFESLPSVFFLLCRETRSTRFFKSPSSFERNRPGRAGWRPRPVRGDETPDRPRSRHLQLAAARARVNDAWRMNKPEFPTPWQRKVIWRALTALAITAIFVIAVGFIYLFSTVLGFLQPILVPFAVAGVLAYLLEPLVAWLVKLGTTRTRAVFAVFAVTTIAFVGLLFWLIPVISTQTGRLARNVPEMTYKVRLGVANFAKDIRKKYGLRILPDELLNVQPPKPPKPPRQPAQSASAAAPGAARDPGEAGDKKTEAATVATDAAHAAAKAATAAAKAANAAADAATVAVEVAKAEPGTQAPTPLPAAPGAQAKAPPAETPAPDKAASAGAPPVAEPAKVETPEAILEKIGSGDWVNDALPGVIRNVWAFFSTSLGGFLGFFGFLLSLIIVPLYLFYLLTESPHISAGWSKYLPLRASKFKDEVVDCITEINGYLIAFFRGQLVVSLVNGVATGALLAAAGLDFGILIGFALCFLGIIPYLGIVLCWIPAVVIASVQGGSWLVPATASWWVFPVVVTGIFTVVQQVDGLFVTPKIVGERVGLHPLTVIFSVFLWTLLLGGLLGAIIAVPMTATMKVILKRYVWERTLMVAQAEPEPVPVSEK